jgi:hypothetical protein
MKEGICIGCICAGIALVVAGISLALASKNSDESYSKLKDMIPNMKKKVIIYQEDDDDKYRSHRYINSKRRRLARGQLYDQE